MPSAALLISALFDTVCLVFVGGVVSLNGVRRSSCGKRGTKRADKTMQHRHLTDPCSLSSAAIDDIIDRGGRAEWAMLRDAARADENVRARIRRVCAAHAGDRFAQKYTLWRLYVR